MSELPAHHIFGLLKNRKRYGICATNNDSGGTSSDGYSIAFALRNFFRVLAIALFYKYTAQIWPPAGLNEIG